MIFISTGYASKQYPEKTIADLIDNGYEHIELSSGKFSKNLKKKLDNFKNKVNLQFHNYFPPPQKNFVLNLASLDEYISRRTISHFYKAIDWSSSIGSKYYSLHAGFRVDIKTNEIGKIIKKKKLQNYEESVDIFIKRLNLISKYAKKRNVELLVENNVVSKSNFESYEANPFLMSNPEECRYIMGKTNKNISMLLDVGHLKVSSKTLNFRAANMFYECEKWIKAYHLSDNDGFSDQNQPFRVNSWFWKYLDSKVKFSTIEVYNIKIKHLKFLYNLTCNKLLNN